MEDILAVENLFAAPISEPAKLDFSLDIAKRFIKIQYTPQFQLSLPYVLNYYHIGFVPIIEQWSFSIWYRDTKSLERTKNKFSINQSPSAETQATAIEVGINKFFDTEKTPCLNLKANKEL
jgi:hypothetical protein